MLYQWVLIPEQLEAANKPDDFVIPGGHEMNRPKYATLEEARYQQTLLRKAHVVVRVPAVASSVITAADDMGISAEALARSVWEIGKFVDANGGQTRGELVAEGLDTHGLDADGLLDGIMFVSDGGRVRRGRSSYKVGGWYINRNYRYGETKVDGLPKWVAQWRSVFGGIEGVLDILEHIEGMIEAWREEQRPKRMHDRPYLEQHSTREIAHRAAVAGLMRDYWHKRFRELMWTNNDEAQIYAYVSDVFSVEARVMTAELDYRRVAEPEQLSSKKKTDEARRDWLKAADYLREPSGGLFTQDYIRAYMAMDTMPLHVGDVPRDVPDKTPAARQSERELLETVVRLAGLDLDADSFEADDRRLLIDTIRKTLEGIKSEYMTSSSNSGGQWHVTTEVSEAIESVRDAAANALQWRIGDIVFHEKMVKLENTLLRVVGYTGDGGVKVVWVNPEPNRQYPPMARRADELCYARDYGFDVEGVE